MRERVWSRLLVGLLALTLTAACGPDPQQVAAPWRASIRMMEGWQTASYGGLVIQVPRGYRVHPSGHWECPNAGNTVYLGRPLPTVDGCVGTGATPAGPYSSVSLDRSIPGFEHSDPVLVGLNGMRVELTEYAYDPDRGSLCVYLPDLALHLSVSYWRNREVAQAIIQTARPAQ